MPSSRNMQGTTSFRALVALAVLFAGVTEAISKSTFTSTSTTTIATTTITITLLYASSSFTKSSQSLSTTFSPKAYALAAVSETTSSRRVTATSTITQTTTVSMPTGSLQSEILNSTNYYRSQHQADPVHWNDTLADYAKDYAQGCIWKHSGGPYGENLAANFENTTLAIDAWANEEDKYSYAKRKYTEANGHFTQLVWQNTTDVGCAVIDCNNDAGNGVHGTYLVCEYSPRGNVIGQFRWNVGKPGISEDGTLGFGSAAARSRSGRGGSALALITVWVLLASVL